MNIGIIGVGKLGLECATVMQQAGHHVRGYDVRQVEAPFPMAESIKDLCEGRDIIFVAVPTPHDPKYGGETPSSGLPPKDFDYLKIRDVLQKLNVYAMPEQLVVLISTVLPGTMRKTIGGWLKNPHRLIYNPYLIAMGSTTWDMINPEMIIIGSKSGLTDESYVETLKIFYETIVKNSPRFVIGTWEEAECIKIFYNTFISMKIGFVNMIQDVAEEIKNIDCDFVAKALADSDQRITSSAFMKPGMGDGGACHPRDNIALSWFAKEYCLGYDIFKGIMSMRERQAYNIACFLAALAENNNLPIYIHGKSYKPGVPYIEGSYSLLIGYYLEQQFGYDILYIDPLTQKSNPESVKGIVFMAHHAPTTYSHSHLIGSDYQKFYTKILPGSIVVDPWRYLIQEYVPGCQLIKYGNTRKPLDLEKDSNYINSNYITGRTHEG